MTAPHKRCRRCGKILQRRNPHAHCGRCRAAVLRSEVVYAPPGATTSRMMTGARECVAFLAEHEARIARYAARALLNLPLFEEP